MTLGTGAIGSVPFGAQGTASATGQEPTASISLPALIVSAIGAATGGSTGEIAVAFPSLSASAVGVGAAIGAGNVGFSPFLADASGTSIYPAAGVASVNMPSFTAALAGTAALPSTAQVTLPSLSAALRGVSSSAAEELPTGATYYYCDLTGAADGLPDARIPMSNFSVRHRAGTDSYYSVTLPGYSQIDVIVARSNGQIVISSDTGGVQEELMRGSLGNVRTDRGASSQTISISGNASQAATPTQTFIITSPSYAYSTFDGEQRLRITPRSAIRPGHYARYGPLLFEIGTVTWSCSVSNGAVTAQMEIATLSV